MQQDKESTGIGIEIIADLVVLILNDEIKHLYDKLAGSCRKRFEASCRWLWLCTVDEALQK